MNAVLSSGGNSVVKRLLLNFKAGSSVRFKATNNSSYPVIDYCQNWDLYGNEAILEPYGAYYSNGTVYDSSGNKVYNQDVYVSDDYVAIINATNFPDASAISPRPMSTTAQRRTLAARAFPISRASSTSLP